MNLLTIVILKVNLLFLKDLADLDLTIVKIVLSYTSCQIDQSHLVLMFEHKNRVPTISILFGQKYFIT